MPRFPLDASRSTKGQRRPQGSRHGCDTWGWMHLGYDSKRYGACNPQGHKSQKMWPKCPKLYQQSYQSIWTVGHLSFFCNFWGILEGWTCFFFRRVCFLVVVNVNWLKGKRTLLVLTFVTLHWLKRHVVSSDLKKGSQSAPVIIAGLNLSLNASPCLWLQTATELISNCIERPVGYIYIQVYPVYVPT